MVERLHPQNLHHAFVGLMERFDLSYQVAEPREPEDDRTSLISQLVSDIRPVDDLTRVWPDEPGPGDGQQVQICRIVDAANGQSATAKGLFYQLIVRLHKYSLGRENHHDSVHWQRGLVLDHEYNGRALIEHVGNDVRITVRAAYPQAFLAILTDEVTWLVNSFWEGLRCEVVVPCVEPCGKNKPGTGVFEVQKLVVFKGQGMTLYPCAVSGCEKAQPIDRLLNNAPAAQRTTTQQVVEEVVAKVGGFGELRQLLLGFRGETMKRFDGLDIGVQRLLSKVDDGFADLMRALVDEGKDGPRLFSFEPVEPGFFDRPKWISERFRVTLWCEHSRLPLPARFDGAGRYPPAAPNPQILRKNLNSSQKGGGVDM